jgi:hypothetical protein
VTRWFALGAAIAGVLAWVWVVLDDRKYPIPERYEP